MSTDNEDTRHPIEKALEGKSKKEKLGNEYYREEKASELGLINIWAYHCNRCNHVWLPKNFDYDKYESYRKDGRWAYHGQDLFFREPPKSCARCKSKYWKDLFMQRVSKSAIADEHGYIMQPTSWERWRMLIGQGQLLKAAQLRPDSKEMLLKSKLLMKVKIDGKIHLTDGKQYLKEPEPEQK